MVILCIQFVDDLWPVLSRFCFPAFRGMTPLNSPDTAVPLAQMSHTLPLVSLDLCPFFCSRLLLHPQLGSFQFDQSWCNLYMYKADSGGLHTDVYLVGIEMYKLNSTWPWRFSWNVDLGTLIVAFWVRIIMQHTKVLVFHLHRLIAVQILAGFRLKYSD